MKLKLTSMDKVIWPYGECSLGPSIDRGWMVLLVQWALAFDQHLESFKILKAGLFWRLPGLLQGISQVKLERNPEQQPCQPKENPVLANCFEGLLLKCIDKSVLAHLRFTSIFCHKSLTNGEFCWPFLLLKKSNKTIYLK